MFLALFLKYKDEHKYKRLGPQFFYKTSTVQLYKSGKFNSLTWKYVHYIRNFPIFNDFSDDDVCRIAYQQQNIDEELLNFYGRYLSTYKVILI